MKARIGTRTARTVLAAAVVALLVIALAVPALAGVNRNYVAHLNGGAEVPPVDTLAQGQAIFQVSKDGTEISYKLIVANLDDVLMSHIHLAPEGTNGPVVAWLYPSSPPPVLIPGVTNGVLAQGTITAASLVGPLTGGDLEDLIEAMNSGGAYVNVHTAANPPGAIRGQIQ